MTNRDLFNLGSALGMPREQVSSAFDHLVSSGVIFTPARTAKEFFATQPPVRFAMIGPTMGKPKSVVSLGPFAISRKFYENIFLNLHRIMSQEEIYVILNFKRLEYEKLGVMEKDNELGGYQVAAPEETMIDFLRLSPLWAVMQPLVYEHFVWIVPNDECREYAESVTGETYSSNDYRWWDTYIDFGNDFAPMDVADVPERYSHMPSALMEGWAKYIPTWIYYALMQIYGEAYQLDNPRGVLSAIELGQILERCLDDWITSKSSFEIDRALLVKEISDFNTLPYPYDADSAINYMSKLGFIVLRDDMTYSINIDIQLPEKVLRLPENWEERFDIFVTTGSVLFAYLSTDEIMA